jgi:hypothetical protein
MDAKKTEALVEVIRAIIGDAAVSRDRIVSLLAEAGNDPNKAVDLFFQAEAANGAEMKQNDVEGDADDADAAADWTPQARELNDLLGGDVKREVILDLLHRTKNNLQKAVEIYFTENGGADADEFSDGEDDEEEDAAAPGVLTRLASAETEHATPPPAPATPSPSSAAMPQAPSAQAPIETHQLEPLAPPSSHAPPAEKTPPAAVETAHDESAPAESLTGPGTYEVIMVNSNFRWQIGNVFGRAVVQHVEPGGPAAKAGIQKSDVLLSFRETVLNEQNCSIVVQQLSREVRDGTQRTLQTVGADMLI